MSQVKILYLEDNQDIAQAVSVILENAGYHVNHVSDISEYKRLLSKDNFDLVLSDIDFYEDGGFLKDSKHNSKFILLGIYPIMNRKLAALKDLGMQAYITKPFTKKKLLDSVQAALGCI